MPVAGFDHYNLRAPRDVLDRLRDFYVSVVGLHAGPRPPFKRFGYWLYAGEKPVLHLNEADAGETFALESLTTFDHAAFRCSDRAAYERRLSELGIGYRVAHVPLAGQVQLFFSDPAGNGIELSFASDEG